MNNMNNMLETTGDRIKKRRLELNWSAKTLADKIKVKQPQVYTWENKRKTPGTVHANNLAKALGVSIDWLLNGPKEEKKQTFDSFGNRLQELMGKHKIDADRLSKLSSIETGKIFMALSDEYSDVFSIVTILADLFGVDRCWLAFGDKR